MKQFLNVTYDKLPDWYMNDLKNSEGYFNGSKLLDICGKDYSFADGKEFDKTWLIQMSMLCDKFLPGYIPGLPYKPGSDVSEVFNRITETLYFRLKNYNVLLVNKLRDKSIKINERVSINYSGDNANAVSLDYEKVLEINRCGLIWLIDNHQIAATLEPIIFGIPFPGSLAKLGADRDNYPKMMIIPGLQVEKIGINDIFAVQIYRDGNKLVIDEINISISQQQAAIVPIVRY